MTQEEFIDGELFIRVSEPLSEPLDVRIIEPERVSTPAWRGYPDEARPMINDFRLPRYEPLDIGPGPMWPKIVGWALMVLLVILSFLGSIYILSKIPG